MTVDSSTPLGCLPHVQPEPVTNARGQYTYGGRYGWPLPAPRRSSPGHPDGRGTDADGLGGGQRDSERSPRPKTSLRGPAPSPDDPPARLTSSVKLGHHPGDTIWMWFAFTLPCDQRQLRPAAPSHLTSTAHETLKASAEICSGKPPSSEL